VKRYRTPLDLQVLEFMEVQKQFFVAQLYNLPTQPFAREESKISSKKIRQLPLERCPVPSLAAFGSRLQRVVRLLNYLLTILVKS
jgi:hypothetical protein